MLLPGVLIVMQRGVIEREERYLERRFGDEYRRYKTCVRHWVLRHRQSRGLTPPGPGVRHGTAQDPATRIALAMRST